MALLSKILHNVKMEKIVKANLVEQIGVIDRISVSTRHHIVPLPVPVIVVNGTLALVLKWPSS